MFMLGFDPVGLYEQNMFGPIHGRGILLLLVRRALASLWVED